ncbi:nuclear transport factor 2 family protein [Pendulispora brunnea]|uniref:Nuclear transport factor 2 family protein n=1 Tax=Pendulispora brunnea TaxID=2905690 RepID=A0ABZ2KFB3_9BACT
MAPSATPGHRPIVRYLRYLTIFLAGCSTAAAKAPPMQNPNTAHYTAPEQAVQAYFKASDQCSGEILRSAFHPAAHMLWLDKAGALHSRAQLPWWRALDTASPCRPALERSLRILDREGPMALVEAHSRFDTYRFHDYLLVVESPDGWLIVDKVFQRLEGDDSPAPADETEVRRILDEKIRAAGEHDSALLASTHLEDCTYSAVNAKRGTPYLRESVSEWAAKYAARKARNEDGHEAKWRILHAAGSGSIGHAKLEVVSRGTRYIDHLLLLKTTDGWRIAAAVWGNPQGLTSGS